MKHPAPDNISLRALGYRITPESPFARVDEWVMTCPDGTEYRSAHPGNLWAAARRRWRLSQIPEGRAILRREKVERW